MFTPRFLELHDTLGNPLIVRIQDILCIYSVYEANNATKNAAIKFLHNPNCVFTKETVTEIADLLNKGFSVYSLIDENKSDV